MNIRDHILNVALTAAICLVLAWCYTHPVTSW